MAVNSRYIQFYTPGTAAEKLNPALVRKPKAVSRPHRKKRPVLYFDPVLILGVVTAIVLMVCMFVGLAAYNASTEELARAERYAESLERQHEQLMDQYKAGYDLEAVRLDAVLMGYVPESEVLHVTLDVPEIPVQQEPDFWQTLLAKLFA